MPMTFGAAAQVGNKNLNIDMRGFGGYAHQISGKGVRGPGPNAWPDEVIVQIMFSFRFRCFGLLVC